MMYPSNQPEIDYVDPMRDHDRRMAILWQGQKLGMWESLTSSAQDSHYLIERNGRAAYLVGDDLDRIVFLNFMQQSTAPVHWLFDL